MVFVLVALMAAVVALMLHSFATHHDTAAAEQAEAIAEELRNGNRLFARNEQRFLPTPMEMRRNLALKGRTPVATIVACPDCRVPMEDIFNQQSGRLFVIYAPGNTAGTQSIGSVQYGVAHLHIPVLVVLGHTQCGAIKAVVSGSREEGCLDRCYDPIRQAGALLDRPVEKYRDPVEAWTIANVRFAADSFLKTNPLLARKVDKRQVSLLEGVYDMETGLIAWLD